MAEQFTKEAISEAYKNLIHAESLINIIRKSQLELDDGEVYLSLFRPFVTLKKCLINHGFP
jgi:hypothetical protein